MTESQKQRKIILDHTSGTRLLIPHWKPFQTTSNGVIASMTGTSFQRIEYTMPYSAKHPSNMKVKYRYFQANKNVEHILQPATDQIRYSTVFFRWLASDP